MRHPLPASFPRSPVGTHTVVVASPTRCSRLGLRRTRADFRAMSGRWRSKSLAAIWASAIHRRDCLKPKPNPGSRSFTTPLDLYPFVGDVREGRPEGLPCHLADFRSWSTGPVGRFATTSAGPSPGICRRFRSGSALPEQPGCSWPRTSRTTSIAG